MDGIDKLIGDVYEVIEMEAQDMKIGWLRENGLEYPILIRRGILDGMVIPSECTIENIFKNTDVNESNIFVMSTDNFIWKKDNCAGDEWISSAGRKRKLDDNATGTKKITKIDIIGTSLEKRVEAPEIISELNWFETLSPERKTSPIRADVLGMNRIMQRKEMYFLLSPSQSFRDFFIEPYGTSLWYHLCSGQSIFYCCPPTPENLNIYYQTKSSSPKSFIHALGSNKVSRIILMPGETLILPCGWIYAIFAQDDCLAFVGNFLHGLAIQTQLFITDFLSQSQHERLSCFYIYWLAAIRSFNKLYHTKRLIDSLRRSTLFDFTATQIVNEAATIVRSKEYSRNARILYPGQGKCKNYSTRTRRKRGGSSSTIKTSKISRLRFPNKSTSPHQFIVPEKEDDDIWLTARRFVLGGRRGLCEIRMLSIALKNLLQDHRLQIGQHIPSFLLSPHVFLNLLDIHLDGRDFFLQKTPPPPPYWIPTLQEHFKQHGNINHDLGWFPGHEIPIPGLFCGKEMSLSGCQSLLHQLSLPTPPTTEQDSILHCTFCTNTQKDLDSNPLSFANEPTEVMIYGDGGRDEINALPIWAKSPLLWACSGCASKLDTYKNKWCTPPSIPPPRSSFSFGRSQRWWWLADFGDKEDREAWCNYPDFLTQNNANISLVRLRTWSYVNNISPSRRRCGQCPQCLADNCGKCKPCLDMKAFGGQGRLRRSCIHRKCQVLFPSEIRRQSAQQHQTTTSTARDLDLQGNKNQNIEIEKPQICSNKDVSSLDQPTTKKKVGSSSTSVTNLLSRSCTDKEVASLDQPTNEIAGAHPSGTTGFINLQSRKCTDKEVTSLDQPTKKMKAAAHPSGSTGFINLLLTSPENRMNENSVLSTKNFNDFTDQSTLLRKRALSSSSQTEIITLNSGTPPSVRKNDEESPPLPPVRPPPIPTTTAATTTGEDIATSQEESQPLSQKEQSVHFSITTTTTTSTAPTATGQDIATSQEEPLPLSKKKPSVSLPTATERTEATIQGVLQKKRPVHFPTTTATTTSAAPTATGQGLPDSLARKEQQVKLPTATELEFSFPIATVQDALQSLSQEEKIVKLTTATTEMGKKALQVSSQKEQLVELHSGTTITGQEKPQSSSQKEQPVELYSKFVQASVDTSASASGSQLKKSRRLSTVPELVRRATPPAPA